MLDQLDLFADLGPADYRASLTRAERDTLEAARAILKRCVASGPVLSSWAVLAEYLGATMGGLRAESLRVLYLDRKNRLIRDEEAGRGTIDHVPVYPREIARRALELDAAAVIVAHNHPTGNTTPSDADRDMTRKLNAALQAVGIILHDHAIIGAGDCYSLRANGDF
jgi:DNA repair protein RadC